MENGKRGEKCWSASCPKVSTHTLTTILKTPGLGDMEVKSHYCLECAVYFAGWLPYCYPDEQTLVGIEPPARELFGR